MTKKSGWKISLRGVEPVLETYSQQKDKSTYRKLYLFYPFRRIVKWWYNRKVKKHFDDIGIPINQCEGCGEGIVEWAIKDPNNPTVDLFVCNHCVGYYDIYITKRRIELQHTMNNIRGVTNEFIRRSRPWLERGNSSNRRK